MKADFPLQYRILVFFASNPEVPMTREDFARKFSVTLASVAKALEYWIEIEVVALRIPPRIPGKIGLPSYIYQAGPRLFEELGGEFHYLVATGV